MTSGRPFDRIAIVAAFEELGTRAREAGRLIEMTVYGGSALILTMNQRPATRDVDAVFEKDRSFVRKLVTQIGKERGWPDNWLNDGVKGFISTAESNPEVKRLYRSYPSEESPGLRVFIPTPEYLFAMKCIAMRLGGVEDSSDLSDIKMLARTIGLSSAEEAISLVSAFYPEERIPAKTRFGLEEIFQGSDDARGD